MAPPSLTIVPEVTNTKFVIGSKNGVVIKCDGALEYFKRVLMDGTEVNPDNYTREEGSTILTFKPEYLNTLSSGKHTVTMEYTYGKVDVPVETATANQTGTGQPDTTGGGTTGTIGGGTASNISNNTASKNAIAPKTGEMEVRIETMEFYRENILSMPVKLWYIISMGKP